MEELKTCPFCGSDTISSWIRSGKYNNFVYLECDVCGAKTRAFPYCSMSRDINWDDIGFERAREAWNRRA